MRTLGKLALGFAVFAFIAFCFRPVVSYAQDMTEESPVTCDSTLVVLLLVAEHDYDYLSHMQTMPNVDLGQYSTLIHGIVAMMQGMDMTDEQIAAMEAMQASLDDMMTMSTTDMLSHYDMTMGMTDMTSDMEMMVLPPGDVAGEAELCTTLREDVEHFLTAHILADMESMGDMGGM